MGLFKKKAPATDEPQGTDATDADDTPRDIATPVAAAPPKASRSGKKVKMSVAELQALRGEISDLRNRLEAAEKAKWTMEHRLNALDATTTTLAGDKTTVTELAGKVHTLELQVGLTRDPDAVDLGDDDTPAVLPSIPDLGTKLAGLEARLAEIQVKLDTPPSPVLQPRPLLPSAAHEPSPAERERLERLETLTQRLAAVDELTAKVGELGDRVNAMAQQGAPPPEADAGLEAAIQAAVSTDAIAAADPGISAVGERIAQLAERLAATDAAARHTSQQVATLDQRLSSISTELANQISELGRDIDGLAATDPHDGGTVPAEVIEALRAGQVRLANEQARYEIAFRQDLAALAEQVRQAGRTR